MGKRSETIRTTSSKSRGEMCLVLLGELKEIHLGCQGDRTVVPPWFLGEMFQDPSGCLEPGTVPNPIQTCSVFPPTITGGQHVQLGYTEQRRDSHPGLDRMGQCEISTHYSEWHAALKLYIVNFWNFPLSIFWP